LKNPDDTRVLVIADAASQSLTSLGNPLHCRFVRRPALFGDLEASSSTNGCSAAVSAAFVDGPAASVFKTCQ
jgi:hypothetical protein